ncbi:MAG: hypothetical protein KDH88_01960 [Chromatiales bacterium]|nr:hypothetical protein [Chromatiales bacterium]
MVPRRIGKQWKQLPMAVVLVMASSGSAMAGEGATYHGKPSAEAMVFDTVVVRPLMLVGTAVGAVLYGISFPFSAAGGNTQEAQRRLVEEPAYQVFGRPLGHFD